MSKITEQAAEMRAKLAGVTDRAKVAADKAKFAADKTGGVLKANALVTRDTGKVLVAGLKEIGSDVVSSSRSGLSVLADDIKAMRHVKSAPELMRLRGEQQARAIEGVSAVAKKNVSELRELIASRVAPMVKDQFRANLELFKKAA